MTDQDSGRLGSRRRGRSMRLGKRVPRAVALAATSVLAAGAAMVPVTATAAAPRAARPLAAAAAALQTPLVKTSVTVGGQANGTVPAPPADALGTPAGSTLVQADDLALTGITRPAGGGQTSNDYWASVSYGKQATLSGSAGNGLRQLLNPNYPTAAGRFRDPDTDRSMAFQMTGDGSNSILQLSSNNLTTEPSWQVSNRPCELVAGNTCEILNYNADHKAIALLSETDAVHGITFEPTDNTFHDTPDPAPAAPSQLWTAVDTGDPDGYVELVSKSDGLCLTADGDTSFALVGTAPCVSANPPAAQLWKQELDKPDQATGSLVPKVNPALALSNDQHCVDCGLLPPALYSPKDVGDWAAMYFYSPNEPGGMIPTWSTELPGTNPAVPLALATGDLDRVVGLDDNYHDEAVVAYADPATHELQVRVVDYNADANHLLATAPDQPLPAVGAVKDGTWFPGSVGVAVGDFGLAGEEALNEIAVTWQDNSGRFHLTMLKYRATATGGRTLTVIGTPTGTTLFTDQQATESLASGFAQTVAGDFAGDGVADVAIAYAAANPGTALLSGHLGVVSLTPDFRVRGETSMQFTDSALIDNAPDGGTWTTQGLRLGSGYFRDDDAAGYTFQRRELAVVWNEWGANHGGRGAAVYDVTDRASDCTSDKCALSVDTQIAPSYEYSALPVAYPIPMAVGGFEGVGTGATAPLWDIVIWSTSPGLSVLRVLQPADNQTQFRPRYDTGFTTITDTTQMVLTAYDRGGASLALGAPLIYTITNMTKPILIAAQPPTHADWLDGRWVNVSRVGDFSVTMGAKTEQNYTNTYTTTASQTDGVTQSADIKTSLREGTKSNNISVAGELKEKFAKNWTETSKAFTKYSTVITTNVEAVSRDDDIVQVDLQTATFYRYPILNLSGTEPDGTVVYPYYQVTIPGQVVQDDGYGRDMSFYQPSWENGNALSYPKLVANQVAIPDLGPYSYVDNTGQTQQVTAPLLDVTNSVGGGSATDELDISHETGTGTTTTNGWNLNTSVQLSGTVSIKQDFGVLAGSASFSASVGYNGARATGTSNVGTTASSQASSLELTIPTIDSNASYRIGTAYYYDTAGTPKVIQGVDLTSNPNSREFWERNYGQAPDPGLNLPDASFLSYDLYGNLISPEFSTLATRQLIRGFAALQPYDPSSPMTSSQPYGTDPEVGDQVIFAAQVHDFSLMDSPSVPVSFYAVPVDANQIHVTGPPQLIGTVPSGAIPSQGDVTVNSPTWTAEGSGNHTDAQNWRIFVIVDPNDSLHDIHPRLANADDPPCPPSALDPKAPAGTVVDGRMIDPMTDKPETLACGQNKQGYGTITIMPRSLGAPLGSGPAPNVTLTGAGFVDPAGDPPAAVTPGPKQDPPAAVAPGPKQDLPAAVTPEPKQDPPTPTVELDAQATGVVQTATTASTAEIQPVLIYDGPPSDGRLIASTTMNGATKAGGGTAQFTWQPTTPGLHTLYYELLGSGPTTNSEQTLQVDVAAPPTKPTTRPTSPPTTPHSGPPTTIPPATRPPTARPVGHTSAEAKLSSSGLKDTGANSPASGSSGRPYSSASSPASGGSGLAGTGAALTAALAAALALLTAGALLASIGRRRHRARRP